MKIIAKLLSIVLVASLMYVPTYAEESTTTEELIQHFVDELTTFDQKDMYIELLELVLELEDPEGMLNAYGDAFNSLSGGELEDLDDMQLILDQMSVFVTELFDSEFGVDELSDYIGVSDNKINSDLLEEALLERQDEFEESIDGLSLETITTGFDRLSTIFGFLNTASSAGGYGVIFSATGEYSDLVLLESNVELALFFVGLATGNFISDTDPVIDAINELLSYYNDLPDEQQEFVYDYFDDYGLTTVVEGTDDGSTDDGSTDDGSTDDGSTDDGSTDDGSTDDGSTDDGSTDDGSTDDGSTDDGSTDDGSTDDGGADDGSADDGSTDDGSTDDRSSSSTASKSVVTQLSDETLAAANLIFGDLGNVEWAWTAIRELYTAEVIKGKSFGVFDPEGYITRAEFSAMLIRLLEADIPVDSVELEAVFNDVNASQWFYKEVMASYENGYVTGVGNNEFLPIENITREQIATIISRVLIEKGISELAEAEIQVILDEFIDNDEVSTWARQGTALLAKLNVINGVNVDKGRMYNYSANATRAEVAVILYRITSVIETKVIVEE